MTLGLTGDQNDSMINVVNVINDKFSPELNVVIADSSEKEHERDTLNEIWKRDSDKQRLQEKQHFVIARKKLQMVRMAIDGQLPHTEWL